MSHLKNPWKTLSSELKYQNPWISVREDQVIRPDGQPGIYGVVSAKVATGTVALTDEGSIYIVGQYRYPLHVYSWEIVEGGAEAGEEPILAAQRELREEAGITAREWQQLGGQVHLSNCFSAEVAYLYFARGLEMVPRQPDGTELLEVRCIPFKDAMQMVHSGEITDAMSIIALFRAERLLAGKFS